MLILADQKVQKIFMPTEAIKKQKSRLLCKGNPVCDYNNLKD